MKPLILLFFLTACSTFQNQRMTRTELYFGLSKPDGSLINDKDFQAFADSVITKKFSSGSTLINAHGQWLGNNGRLITEPSKILIVVSVMNAQQSAAIEQVRTKYKQYFQQEAVMRVDSKVKVGF